MAKFKQTRPPPQFVPGSSKKRPSSPAPPSPDSVRNARDKPGPAVETSAAPGPPHLRTPESVAGETLSDNPMDYEPQGYRSKQQSPPRRRSFKYDSYRPQAPSKPLHHDPSPPPRAPNAPSSGSEVGPTLNKGQPRARSPPTRPAAAAANDTEASKGPSKMVLRQNISRLASNITQAASISARKELLAQEALEQSNVYKSQLKHKDAFTTLFEEAAFRAAQAEQSSRRVNEEMKEIQSAQNAAVEKLTETLCAGYVWGKDQQASNLDQPPQRIQEALDDLQRSLHEIRIDIDFLNRNTVIHEHIDKKLALYATKQQLRDITPAKGQMPDKDRELQQTSDMVKQCSAALDQLRSKLAELDEKSGNQDNKIHAIEGQLEPVTTHLASHHARLVSIEQTPMKVDQAVTAEYNLDKGSAETETQAQEAEVDQIESINQKLNVLSEELQKIQSIPRRAEETALPNPPDEVFDKAVETTAGHFRNEMDKRGQIITEVLTELSSDIRKVAEDLELLRTDVQMAQAQQPPSSSSLRAAPSAMTTSPPISEPVAAPTATTAPPASLSSAVAPSTVAASPLPTAPAHLASSLPPNLQPIMETFQNMLEQYSSRSSGEVESLRLFVTGQQQRMDGLRGAVEQLYNVHPVQVSAHIHRLLQGQQYLEQQQKAQTKELESNLRKMQKAEVDPMKSQLELSHKLLKQLEDQVHALSQSASAFKIEQEGVIKDLIQDIHDSRNPVVELNDRVNTVIGRTTIDIMALKEQITALKSGNGLSSTVVATTNDRGNSAELDSDEPMINRTRPSEKRTPNAFAKNHKRKVPFDSSDENEEPLASNTRKLDRVVKRMNVSKRGDTTN